MFTDAAEVQNVDDVMHVCTPRFFRSASPPALKLNSKTYGTMEKTGLEFVRLSLPVKFHDQFVSPRFLLFFSVSLCSRRLCQNYKCVTIVRLQSAVIR